MNQTSKTLASIIITIMISFQLLFSATLVVDQGGSGDHTTISATVSAASSGDIIQVNSGLYLENIYISAKDLTINGADPSSTTIYTSNVPIESSNSNLTISGLKFSINLYIFAFKGVTDELMYKNNFLISFCFRKA